MKIVSLASVPDYLPLVECLFVEEWPSWYGSDGPGDAHADLVSCTAGTAQLPSCLIALSDAHEVCGTVSLRDTSPGSDKYPGVWLTALVVSREWRRIGIGDQLVAAAEAEACRLGFAEMFVSTSTAAGLVMKRGWVLLETIETQTGPLEIYRKPLGNSWPD